MAIVDATGEYEVNIDWHLDGWGGTYDDVAANVRQKPGIRVTAGKDAARPRSRPMVPEARFELNNVNKRYSAENAGSPIYQYILPDRPTQIAIRAGADVDYDDAAVDYDDITMYYEQPSHEYLLTGLADEPVYQPARDQQSVAMDVLGNLVRLRGLEISTRLESAIRTDQAIALVLDAASWPAADRVLSVGDTTMTWWWVDKQDAFQALVDLLETEGTGASLYEDGLGRLVFENRNYRQTETRCTTSQATFGPNSTKGIREFAYTQGMREMYNDVRMTMRRRVAQSVAKVWEYGQALTLTNSEVRIIKAVTSDPIQSVQGVTVTTDYVVSAGSLASVLTQQINANLVQITFTAGAGGATVLGPASATTGPQLRAAAVPEVSEETVFQTAGAGSGLIRTRTLDLTAEGARAEVAPADAVALCNVAANYYRGIRPTVMFEIVNNTPELLEQMLLRKVSDRITVIEGPNGFSGDIWIEQLSHQVDVGGKLHRLGIIGSKALDFTASPALWNSGLWNTGLWGT